MHVPSKPREACGVFGIYNHPEAAALTYFGLYALQHRGQESAGIAAADGGVIDEYKGMGLVPDVFDMDTIEGLNGLTAIGPSAEMICNRSADTVLTPHLGEMERLTGLSREAIQDDPVGILQKTAGRLQAIIVLKGAHSLIGFPDQRVYVNTTGNHAMATAGAGDVLTGDATALSGGPPVTAMLVQNTNPAAVEW
mgnify:CR=1 FL=1